MVVLVNVIKPQGLEPLQFPTKFRSPSAQVGTNDRFLDIGGDSLKAMRVANRIVDVFALNLSLADLMDASTVAKLAKLIDAVGK